MTAGYLPNRELVSSIYKSLQNCTPKSKQTTQPANGLMELVDSS